MIDGVGGQDISMIFWNKIISESFVICWILDQRVNEDGSSCFDKELLLMSFRYCIIYNVGICVLCWFDYDCVFVINF